MEQNKTSKKTCAHIKKKKRKNSIIYKSHILIYVISDEADMLGCYNGAYLYVVHW